MYFQIIREVVVLQTIQPMVGSSQILKNWYTLLPWIALIFQGIQQDLRSGILVCWNLKTRLESGPVTVVRVCSDYNPPKSDKLTAITAEKSLKY